MKRKNYMIDKRNIKRLEAEKERTGLSKSDIVRRALDLYFQQKKDQL